VTSALSYGRVDETYVLVGVAVLVREVEDLGVTIVQTTEHAGRMPTARLEQARRCMAALDRFVDVQTRPDD
jgi:hypothetical protein